MRTYTIEQARSASIAYFGGDELAADVFVSKYALRDLDGNIYESVPTEMHRRLAKEFARIESKYPNPMSEKEIFGLLADLGDVGDVDSMTWEELESHARGFGPVIAQGSPMSAIGNPFQFQSLSNCFVIDSPSDSYGGIMKTDQEQAQIMKRRGGVGFDISTIRPKGVKTANAARTTDGIAVFMERFSNTCREVAQGGRRGALMLCIDVLSPEVDTFINIKRDLKKVTGANTSIKMHDEFMHAVKDNKTVTLKFPIDSTSPIVENVVDAKKIWDDFTDAAWATGEPAPLFWDTITRRCPADIYKSSGFGSIATNPCVTGDTIVHTTLGDKTVKELSDANERFVVKAYDVETQRVVEKSAIAFKTKENATLLQLTTKSGKKIRLTPDHRVYTQRGWIEAQHIHHHDEIMSCIALSKCGHEWDEIAHIESVNNEDVYDLTVDDVHNFFANDLLVHNCSELTLAGYDTCRLMLVNVAKFINDPFTSFAKFDVERYDKVVQKAQRLMDDLVDLELEAIGRIVEKIESDNEPEDIKRVELEMWKKVMHMAVTGRRTGLGMTAIGDALAYLNIRYGSAESIEMAEQFAKALCLGAYRSSVRMAKERGAFPICDVELEKGHEFLDQVMSQDDALASDHKKYGRRNIALTTLPPAGSTSICAQVTSGPEPVFKYVYDRRKKVNANDSTSTVDFVDDMGDKWHTFKVVHHGLLKWMQSTGKTLEQVSESPYYNASAHDIDWVQKVKLQAAMQKWICHSISSTVNLPNSATVDDVRKIYMAAWELGCKGITVYRDGSRAGVLVSNDVPKEKHDHDAVIDRPKSLPCDIHRVNVKGESYLVIVGLIDGKPYEVFAGRSEYVEVPKKAKTGVLIKNGKKDGRSTYNLKIPVGDDDVIVFKDIVELFDNPLYGAFTRTISLALRYKVPVQDMVEQLRKDKHSDIMSFSSVIARVLAKNYILDGTKATTNFCPKCNGKNMAYMNGCVTCMDCGDSKCM